MARVAPERTNCARSVGRASAGIRVVVRHVCPTAVLLASRPHQRLGFRGQDSRLALGGGPSHHALLVTAFAIQTALATISAHSLRPAYLLDFSGIEFGRTISKLAADEQKSHPPLVMLVGGGASGAQRAVACGGGVWQCGVRRRARSFSLLDCRCQP